MPISNENLLYELLKVIMWLRGPRRVYMSMKDSKREEKKINATGISAVNNRGHSSPSAVFYRGYSSGNRLNVQSVSAHSHLFSTVSNSSNYIQT